MSRVCEGALSTGDGAFRGRPPRGRPFRLRRGVTAGSKVATSARRKPSLPEDHVLRHTTTSSRPWASGLGRSAPPPVRRSGGGKAAVRTAFGPPGSADRAAPPAAHRACRPLHAAGTQWQHAGAEWEHWRLHSCAHHHAPRAAAAAATVTAAAAAGTAAAAAAASGCCASGSDHP